MDANGGFPNGSTPIAGDIHKLKFFPNSWMFHENSEKMDGGTQAVGLLLRQHPHPARRSWVDPGSVRCGAMSLKDG